MIKDKLDIFIIEDNKLFATMLRAEFEKASYLEQFEVHVFENGEACESRLSLQPDLAIVDYHLDGVNSKAMNGIEVIQLIKERSPETVFIMITMDEKAELFLRSKEEGVYDHITKGPLLPFKLELSIQQWLKWRSNQ